MSDERRQFARLNLPVYFRPARRRLPQRQVVDIGLGGARVYSDEDIPVGTRFDIELFLPDGHSLSCLAEVMWVRALLEPDAPAKYDVGLGFLDVPQNDLATLRDLLLAERGG